MYRLCGPVVETFAAYSRHLGGSLDAALFFDGLVGGGDAVEAGAGLLLVFGAHVADFVGVELDGHAAEGLLDFAVGG